MRYGPKRSRAPSRAAFQRSRRGRNRASTLGWGSSDFTSRTVVSDSSGNGPICEDAIGLASCGARRVGLAVERHERCEANRNLALAALLQCADARLGDHQGTARLYHTATRDQTLALRRGQEIELILHGHDRRIGRHQGERRIAAGIVRDHAHNAAVDEVVLLSEVLAIGKLDSDLASLNLQKSCAYLCHGALARETVAHARLKLRIAHVKSVHGQSL